MPSGTNAADERTHRPWKIVIIEDDALQLKALSYYLTAADYSVFDFQSAEKAIREISAISPDMILLDVNLEGASGLDVCRQIKQNPDSKDVPVIFVTGASDTRDIVRGFEVGAVDYIRKPVHKKELLVRLQTHLSIYNLQHQLKNQYDMLAESEDRFRSLFEYAFIGIVILNPDNRIVMVNNQIENMLQYDRQELLDQPLDILIPERFREAHVRYCEIFIARQDSRMMGSGKCFVARRKDGTELPVEIGLSIIRSQSQDIIMCYIIDVTKRKMAEDERDALEQALRKSNENLEKNVIERTRQLAEAQAKLLEQQRLQQEIELAAQVQASLMPDKVPQIEGFDFAATATPAHYVSGDLYDFIQTSPQDCYVVLADISGKGVPSALLNSTAHTLVRAESKHVSSPAALLKNVNSTLFADLSQVEMFITFFVAHLDTVRRKLVYANAGHTEFIWWERASRTCRLFPTTGIPIGIFEDIDVEENTIALRPGDVFVFYSDGVTEAADSDEQLFGVDRLVDIVCANAEKSASELSDYIIQLVEDFQAGAPRSDDLTLIVLKIRPYTMSWDIPAQLERLDETLTAIHDAIMGYPEEFAYQFELAVSEIVTNVFTHAYRDFSGNIRFILNLTNNAVQFDLYDQGKPFDFEVSQPDFDEPQEGGYGLYIVQQIVDELKYEAGTEQGNHWKLVKKCNQALE